MPNESTPVEKLNQLATEANSFFEQVRGEPTNAWRLSEGTRGRLSREQQAIADRLGHDLRQQMALLVPAIQSAPLLDKRDLARFLGGAKRWKRHFDPAISHAPRGRFPSEPFFPARLPDSQVLEFVPLQGYFELSMLDRPASRLGRNHGNTKLPVKTQSVK